MISFAMALGAIVQQVNEQGLIARNIPEDLQSAFEGDRPNCLKPGAGTRRVHQRHGHRTISAQWIGATLMICCAPLISVRALYSWEAGNSTRKR